MSARVVVRARGGMRGGGRVGVGFGVKVGDEASCSPPRPDPGQVKHNRGEDVP